MDTTAEQDEKAWVDQRQRSRLAARPVPRIPDTGAPPTDPPSVPSVDSGGEVGIGALLDVKWDGSTERRSVRHTRRAVDTHRIYRELGPVGAILGPDGNAYIQLGAPAVGRLWELRNLLVFFTDPFTAAPGGALAALQAGTYMPGNVRMTDTVTPGVAVPQNIYFSGDQELVFGGQVLYVIIHTPGASPQLYSATCTVREYNADYYKTLLTTV